MLYQNISNSRMPECVESVCTSKGNSENLTQSSFVMLNPKMPGTKLAYQWFLLNKMV